MDCAFYPVASPLSRVAYTHFHFTAVNPILTMRFAVSLKRSADLDGSQEWKLEHFSTVDFASCPPRDDGRSSAVCEEIEMDPVDRNPAKFEGHDVESRITGRFPIFGVGYAQLRRAVWCEGLAPSW